MTWLGNRELSGLELDAQIRSWLLETDLLTTRLRRDCPGAFSLRVLPVTEHPALWEVPASLPMSIRRVIMSTGGVPCIFAESILPNTTVQENPWLGSLGEQPLGERLKASGYVARDSQQYARLDLRDPLLAPLLEFVPDIRTSAAPEIWARRSKFRLDDAELWVAEVFLPGALRGGQ